MPALETFDWLKNEIWPMANEDLRRFLTAQRDYLLKIRSEDERRRFTDELIRQVKDMTKPQRA